MKLIEAPDRLLGVYEYLFLVLANACLIIMLTINVVNIAQRAVIDVSIKWVFPWSVVLFVWMTFFGFFVIYRRKKDITVDFVIDRMGPQVQKAARLMVDAIVIVLMAIMLWHAPKIISMQVGVIEMVGLERYSMSVPLFISCFLILLNFLVDVARTLGEGDATPATPGESAGR